MAIFHSFLYVHQRVTRALTADGLCYYDGTCQPPCCHTKLAWSGKIVAQLPQQAATEAQPWSLKRGNNHRKTIGKP